MQSYKTLDASDASVAMGVGMNGAKINSFLDDSIMGMESPNTRGVLQLPKINEKNKSPFKGFLDISITT